MVWRYGAKRFKISDGETAQTVFQVVEVYENDGEQAATVEPVHIYGQTPQNLVMWLRRAAKDIEQHGEHYD